MAWRHTDAPDATRQEVLARLRALRDGYLKRRCERHRRLHDRSLSTYGFRAVFGTDRTNGYRGFDAVSKFI